MAARTAVGTSAEPICIDLTDADDDVIFESATFASQPVINLSDDFRNPRAMKRNLDHEAFDAAASKRPCPLRHEMFEKQPCASCSADLKQAEEFAQLRGGLVLSRVFVYGGYVLTCRCEQGHMFQSSPKSVILEWCTDCQKKAAQELKAKRAQDRKAAAPRQPTQPSASNSGSASASSHSESSNGPSDSSGIDLKRRQQELFAKSREKFIQQQRAAHAQRRGLGMTAAAPGSFLSPATDAIGALLRERDANEVITVAERAAAIEFLMAAPNPRARLGLDPAKPVSKAIATKHYKRLALLVHPDKNTDVPQADQAFKLLLQAYEAVCKTTAS